MWMEIIDGEFPNALSPIDSVMNIGDPLSVIIHIKDNSKKTLLDAKALDCWAFDSQLLGPGSLNKIQLTTKEGCPV